MPFSYTTMARPKKSEHYVNNKDFLAALEQYAIEVERAKEKEFKTTDSQIHWRMLPEDC